MGKIIVIDGTDCSGKETQSKMLLERLKLDNYKVNRLEFPVYDSPSGRIVGGPYLGKEEICEGWFPEGAPKVDWKTASLYFAADRRYNLPYILEELNKNDVLILDRYVFSNMGYQVSKLEDPLERKKAFEWLLHLEFDMLELPRPDGLIILKMPIEFQDIIKTNRKALDQLEKSREAQMQAYQTYMEMSLMYNASVIECVKDGSIRSKEDINEEVYGVAKKLILK